MRRAPVASGNEDDAVAVRAVSGAYVERIRRSGNVRRRIGRQTRGRERLFHERGRNIELVWIEIIPIRQRPRGRPAGGDDVLAYLILEGDQISAVPGWKIPGGVLALAPALQFGGGKRRH